MLNIKTNNFQGPLGLLLQLIEKEEMDITQVCLAKIADQYIDYINKSKEINPDEMADFLVVAARLLLIKSRALLPFLHPEEEKEIAELEYQLKMYKEFLEAMKKIELLLKLKRFMFPREFNRRSLLANLNIFSPPKNLTKEYLKEIFAGLIKNIYLPAKLEEEILERKVHIEEKIAAIQKILIEKMKVGFNKIISGARSKTEVIVSFLAMLELIKQREILVNQEELFEEITISKT